MFWSQLWLREPLGSHWHSATGREEKTDSGCCENVNCTIATAADRYNNQLWQRALQASRTVGQAATSLHTTIA